MSNSPSADEMIAQKGRSGPSIPRILIRPNYNKLANGPCEFAWAFLVLRVNEPLPIQDENENTDPIRP